MDFPYFLNCVRILTLKIKNTKKDRQNKKVLERNKNILYSLVVLIQKRNDLCEEKKKDLYKNRGYLMEEGTWHTIW